MRGEDCISIRVRLTRLSEREARFETAFLPPTAPCLDMAREWMSASGSTDSPNNFQQIKRNDDGTYLAMWGQEEFVVRSVVSRKDGKILTAEMDNLLRLRARIACNEALDACKHEAPHVESDDG